MKKLILLIGAFVAIATIYISCDTRKFLKDETPVPPALVVDSIAFDLTRDVDTINTQVLTFGGYSWRFRCFDKNKNPLTNVSLPASFHYLLNTGTQSYNTKTLSDTTLRSDSYYYIKYLPAYVNGKHQFVIALNNGHGKTFTDTVRFFVKTYTGVAYNCNLTPKYFSCLRPTSSNGTFKVNITSGDPNGLIKYYLNM